MGETGGMRPVLGSELWVLSSEFEAEKGSGRSEQKQPEKPYLSCSSSRSRGLYIWPGRKGDDAGSHVLSAEF